MFTSGVIYAAQVFVWETSQLRADTVITLDLQTLAVFLFLTVWGQRYIYIYIFFFLYVLVQRGSCPVVPMQGRWTL